MAGMVFLTYFALLPLRRFRGVRSVRRRLQSALARLAALGLPRSNSERLCRLALF